MIVRAPYARWTELIAEVASSYAKHGKEAWHWVRSILSQPDFEVLFDVIKEKGGGTPDCYKPTLFTNTP